MKNWIRVLLVPVAALSLGFVACNDDGGTTKTDTTVADTTVAETNAAETTPTVADTDMGEMPMDTTVAETTPAETTPSETAEEVAPSGACTDPTPDLAYISAHSGNTDAKNPAKIAQDCGLACLAAGADAAVRTCAVDCITNGKTAGATTIEATDLTDECAGCYADVVICAKNNCLVPCLDTSPAGMAACATCRQEKGCTAAFYVCSGLTPPPANP